VLTKLDGTSKGGVVVSVCERGRERKKERERVCVCVCMCVLTKLDGTSRGGVFVSVCVRVRVRVRVRVCVDSTQWYLQGRPCRVCVCAVVYVFVCASVDYT